MDKAGKFFLIILPVLMLVALGVLVLSANNFRLIRLGEGCGCDFKTATGEFDASENQAFFENQPVLVPLAAFPEPLHPPVLGEVFSDDRWIEVDLSEQKLIAWERGNKFLETLVSSGKWGRTPTGEYRIWGKFKYAKMSGGDRTKNTYYYLPNVPYTMYFYKDFGLHGTYWHNNFGQPMSHGCVNLPTLAAEKLFYWATPSLPLGKNSVTASNDNVGTRVVIHN